MAKSVKLRRGKTIEHINRVNNTGFTGEVGEITVDTDLNTIRVHDSVTLGGHALATTEAPVFTGVVTAQEVIFNNSFATLSAFPTASASNRGMVAHNQADGKEYYSNGTTWIALVQTNELSNLVNGGLNFTGAAGDAGVFVDRVGTQLRFKKLRPGNNITISTGDTEVVQISAANYAGANTNVGLPVFKDINSNTFNFRGIQAGNGITVSAGVNDNSIVIASNLTQAFNTVNVNNSTNIVTTQANDTVKFLSGTGVNLVGSVSGKSVTANVALTATNSSAQTGSGVLASYAAATFTFNKIQAGTGIQLSTGAHGEIVVSAPQIGTVTDGANAQPPSPTSLGIYKENANGVLTFYNLAVGDGLSITYDSGDDNIVLTNTTAGGGGAGIGTIQSGQHYRLSYYVGTGTVVGPTSSSVYFDAQNNKLVTDITGQVSDISNHTTTDLTEGDNLYWTDTRFDDRLDLKTTTNLAEGDNLYFTDERAQDAVSSMLLLGNGNLTSLSATTTAVSTSTATITVANTSGIANGYVVTGSTVPINITHTVQSVASGSFVVSPAVYAITGTAFTITNPSDSSSLRVNATAPSTSTAIVTVTDTTGITANQIMTGVGVTGTSTVQTVTNGTQLVLTPGYNVRVASGVSLTFSTLTSTGVTNQYSDVGNYFTYSVDNNYISQRARTAISVQAGQGLTYDNVSGQLSLSGAVTQVNGQTGTVILAVGDITGAAPSASPVFTGSPRTVNISPGDDLFKIANKKYVDDNILSVRGGSPSAGLTTIQALGAAINGDTLFYQTVNSLIDLKLSRSGGTITGVLLLNHTVEDTDDDKTAATKRYVDVKATVQTVNSKSGNVILNADDIYERVDPPAVNKYFTDARARAAISAVSDGSIDSLLSYDNTTGVIKFNASQVRTTVSVEQDNASLTLLSYSNTTGVIKFNPNTDVLTEGSTNQFYTTARARGVISAAADGTLSSFLTYTASTGRIAFNANSDRVSEGSNNLYFTNTRARTAITLTTSGAQTSLLTYNSSSGQFAVNATTTYIAEGTNQYYTDGKVRAALGVTITNSNNVLPESILQYSNVSGIFSLNANTNSIYEGTTNLFFTPLRARTAIALTSDDTTVLTYDNASGAFTFNKPNTDKISEGTTNKYATTTTVRPMVSAVVTTTAGVSSASHLAYSSSTGAFTINANTDSIVEGTTNKYYLDSRARAAITLTTTTVNSTGTALLSYSSGAFTFNNSTDSLAEGQTNKYASDSTVRSKLSVTGGYGGVMTYTSSTGVFTPTISVNTANIVYTPGADGSATKTFDTVQNIGTAATPKFNNVSRTCGFTPGTPLSLSAGVATCNLNSGTVFEFNRSSNMTDIAFTNTPASGNFIEVTVSLLNVSGGGWTFTTGSQIKWQAGTKPNLVSTSTAAGTRDVFTFITWDGGTTWIEKTRALDCR